jgi:hypothetical protein
LFSGFAGLQVLDTLFLTVVNFHFVSLTTQMWGWQRADSKHTFCVYFQNAFQLFGRNIGGLGDFDDFCPVLIAFWFLKNTARGIR